MENGKKNKELLRTIAPTDDEVPASIRPALVIDYALYQHYLDDYDLTDDQKREFLDTLWSIIVSFVDLGFGVHPLQQAALDGCGQNGIPTEFLTPDSEDLISLNDSPKSKFIAATEGSANPSPERSQK